MSLAFSAMLPWLEVELMNEDFQTQSSDVHAFLRTENLPQICG